MRTASRLAVLLAFAIALAASGCFNPFSPRVSTQRSVSAPAPEPSSPTNVIKLFAWCWANRDPSLYREIFTDDYRFIFAPNDSAGTPYSGSPWIREYEMSMATHMFQGGLDVPPASAITIDVDNPLIALPDPRPGKTLRWHRSVRTYVSLKITVDNNGTPDVSSVTGHALFYVVRGDSAVIPAELGFKPDSTRWWIERWEDETASTSPNFVLPARDPLLKRGASPFSSLPPGPVTMGQVKTTWL
jgi:hypothetical protein